MRKPSVYVETSVVSYLTARPSRDIIVAAQQTALVWRRCRWSRVSTTRRTLWS